MWRAGCTTPRSWMTTTSRIRDRSIDPLRNARDRATVIACLFGDTAAKALGYPPHGLTDRAGLALALNERGISFAAPSSP